MDFDGSQILIEDQVFCLLQGLGRVVRLNQDKRVITAQFGNRTFQYRNDGYNLIYRTRTLYWRDPRIITPPRDAERWELMKALTEDISRHLLNG